MRIVASQVALSAATSITRTTTESTAGRFWIGDRQPTDNVRVSDQARTTALIAGTSQQNQSANARRGAVEQVRGSSRPPPPDMDGAVGQGSKDPKATSGIASDEELLGSPEGSKLLVLRRLLEAMTGKQIRLVRPEDLKLGEADQQAMDELATQSRAGSPTPNAANSGNERAGWGLELELERIQIETTSVEFAARGTIVTADGKAITFDASFLKQDASITVEKLSLRAGDAQMKDPLVLLYSGTHAELSQQMTAFDLDANGQLERLPGLDNGAYVVRDLDHNGKVDDGTEMLGALSGDGFADLRAMDEDGNGFVDGGDRKYSDLSLWQPGPDGSGQLTSLAAAGVIGLYTGNVATAFELRATESRELQGRVRTTGIYLTEDGNVRPLEQIDVKV